MNALVTFLESNILHAPRFAVLQPGTSTPLHTVVVESLRVAKKVSPVMLAAQAIESAIERDLTVRKGATVYMTVALDADGTVLGSHPEIRTGRATVDMSEGALKLAGDVLNHSLGSVDKILLGAGNFMELMQTTTGRFHERVLRQMDVLGNQNEGLHEQLVRARANQSTLFDAWLVERERVSRLTDPKEETDRRGLEKTLEAIQGFGKDVVAPMVPAVSALIMAWGQKLLMPPTLPTQNLSQGEPVAQAPRPPPAVAVAPAQKAPTTNVELLRFYLSKVTDAELSQAVAMLMSIHTFGVESEDKATKETRRGKVLAALLGPMREEVRAPIIDLIKRVFQEFLGIQEALETEPTNGNG